MSDATDQSLTLLLAAVMGPGAAFEAAERLGAGAARRDETLPTNMHGQREIFEKMGVSFGEEVPGDPLFTRAKLPPGWRKENSSDPLNLALLDDEGRERARIFFKPAFYDRRADMRACTRYSARGNYSDPDYLEYARGVVYDGKVEIWTTRRVEVTAENRDGVYVQGQGHVVKPIRDLLRDEAARWLDENRPGWTDPLARWGDPPPGEKLRGEL